MRLLDTDVLVDLLRGKSNATDWFRGLAELPVVPGLAAMELLQGCQNNTDRRKVDKLLRPLTLVWPSEAEQANAYAHYHDYALSHGIGLLDCLIAFTAVGRGDTLCTFNLRHFRTVPVLTTEQPYLHT